MDKIIEIVTGISGLLVALVAVVLWISIALILGSLPFVTAFFIIRWLLTF